MIFAAFIFTKVFKGTSISSELKVLSHLKTSTNRMGDRSRRIISRETAFIKLAYRLWEVSDHGIERLNDCIVITANVNAVYCISACRSSSMGKAEADKI